MRKTLEVVASLTSPPDKPVPIHRTPFGKTRLVKYLAAYVDVELPKQPPPIDFNLDPGPNVTDAKLFCVVLLIKAWLPINTTEEGIKILANLLVAL